MTDGCAQRGWSVHIENGPAFDVAAEEDTVLRAAVRAGIGWPYECSVGGCGACRFELLEGEVADLWPDSPGLTARERARRKHLACQSRPLSDLRIRVRCEDSLRPAIVPQRRVAELVARRSLTHDMDEFTFQADGPARFLPGQYALLYPADTPGARAYSMSNLPNAAGLWQFIIRRVPGGRGSSSLFGATVGSRVDMDAPYGHAHLRPSAQRDIVCIAGGSGLAPMLSVCRAVLAEGGSRRVHFFYGVRSQADLGSADLLRQLRDERFAATVVLSSPVVEQAWEGAVGFVHEQVARELDGPLDRFDFYFAGPPPMIEAMQDLLMVRHRVPFSQIHFDRFV